MPITTRLKGGRKSSSKPGSARATAIVFSVFGLLLLLAAGALWLAGGPESSVAVSPRSIGGPFTLTSADGRVVTDQDLHGKYALVYFGYTFCPDVCPTTLQQVTVALDKLGARAERLQPVFITLDPQRDTPKVMATYTAAFTPRLLGLTGTDQQIANVEHEYHVYASVRRVDAGNYSVDHSSVLYLMGPDGRFVAPIQADESGAEIAADILRYLS